MYIMIQPLLLFYIIKISTDAAAFLTGKDKVLFGSDYPLSGRQDIFKEIEASAAF